MVLAIALAEIVACADASKPATAEVNNREPTMAGPTMSEVIDQLFSSDRDKSTKGREVLKARGAVTRDDAEAILSALSRDVPPEVYKPKQWLLATIQSQPGDEAAKIFKTKGVAGIIAAYPKLDKDERAFALKMLALIGSKEALAFLVGAIKADDGPKDFFISTALGAINKNTPHVDVLFPALSPVMAAPAFRAVAVLDLANQLALAGTLKEHPAGQHLDKLRAFINSKDEDEYSYAVSACLALAFVPGAAADELLHAAERHPDENVRLEALYVLVRRGSPEGEAKLAKAVLDPRTSQRAREYLHELGKDHFVPKEANDAVFAAKAEMSAWLAHPMEYGRPPDSIELWDRRKLHWPPTNDTRELFLFKYSYPSKEPGTSPDVGVGLVGSVTFSLFGETRPAPEGTPEDALATHCVWELENNDDPRGKGRDIEVGRKLLGFAPKKKL